MRVLTFNLKGNIVFLSKSPSPELAPAGVYKEEIVADARDSGIVLQLRKNFCQSDELVNLILKRNEETGAFDNYGIEDQFASFSVELYVKDDEYFLFGFAMVEVPNELGYNYDVFATFK